MNVSTIKSWLSILEQSYLTFSLQPYYANARKRLTKTPKLYFYDTGLLCYLLKIGSLEQLLESPYAGAVFENLIVSETAKSHLNVGENPELYFYRDDGKREIDLLDCTNSGSPKAIEIKSSRTYHDKYARHLQVYAMRSTLQKMRAMLWPAWIQRMSRKTVAWSRRVIGFCDNKFGVLTTAAKGPDPFRGGFLPIRCASDASE